MDCYSCRQLTWRLLKFYITDWAFEIENQDILLMVQKSHGKQPPGIYKTLYFLGGDFNYCPLNSWPPDSWTISSRKAHQKSKQVEESRAASPLEVAWHGSLGRMRRRFFSHEKVEKSSPQKNVGQGEILLGIMVIIGGTIHPTITELLFSMHASTTHFFWWGYNTISWCTDIIWYYHTFLGSAPEVIKKRSIPRCSVRMV